MPSGSRRIEVGSDHHSPLKVFCWFFWCRTPDSITSTITLTPTSSHISAIISVMALSFARYPTVVSRTTGSPR